VKIQKCDGKLHSRRHEDEIDDWIIRHHALLNGGVNVKAYFFRPENAKISGIIDAIH